MSESVYVLHLNPEELEWLRACVRLKAQSLVRNGMPFALAALVTGDATTARRVNERLTSLRSVEERGDVLLDRELIEEWVDRLNAEEVAPVVEDLREVLACQASS